MEVRAAVTYAVVWREVAGPVYAGRLELDSDRIRLEGTSRSGGRRLHELPFRAVSKVRIGRTAQERIDGRPAVVLERPDGKPLLITDAAGIGVVYELADRLAPLCSPIMDR